MSRAPTSRSSEAPTGSSTIRAARPVPGSERCGPSGQAGVGRAAGRRRSGSPARRPRPASARTAPGRRCDLAVPFSPRTSTPPTAGRDRVEQQRQPQVVHAHDRGERVVGTVLLMRGSPRRSRDGWFGGRPDSRAAGGRHGAPGGTNGSPGGGPCLDQPQQRAGVRVLLDEVAEPVELLLAQRAEAGVGRGHEAPPGVARRPGAGTPGGSRRSPASRASACPRRRPTRQPSRHSPPSPVTSARRRRPRPRRGGSRSPRPARRAPGRPAAASVFCRANRTRTGSSPRPATVPARDSTSSSMVSPSIWKPPQMPSTGRPSAARRDHGVGEPARAQPRQRPHGAAGAGQHHQVGVGQLLGPVGEPHHDARLRGQRVDVGEVRHQRDRGDRDPQHVLAVRRGRAPARGRRRAATPAARPPRRCPGRAGTAARRASAGR